MKKMDRIDKLVDAWFEGTITERDEQRLKRFLSRPEGSGTEYDEIRAVMGFFSEGRRHYPAAGKTVAFPRWAKALAAACSLAAAFLAGSLVSFDRDDAICFSLVGGKTVTEESIVMEEVENTLADLFSGHDSIDEQLNDFFNK